METVEEALQCGLQEGTKVSVNGCPYVLDEIDPVEKDGSFLLNYTWRIG